MKGCGKIFLIGKKRPPPGLGWEPNPVVLGFTFKGTD
jgi:hypothetical protein